ncbi:MAG: PIG-L family deacetylase, partial [Actinomycetota bacterium]|nr:PIG-L family deacetylase [Actinomycetota bacterium]
MNHTLLSFHAHPDDEAIFTGGLLVLARRAGWRTVVVFATDGSRGGPGDPDAIVARRRAEAAVAAGELGVDAVEFLGYRDSGMADEPTNHDDGALARADIDEVAARLAGVARRHGAEAMTSYDDRGVYGHPDHVAVHRAARALRAAGDVAELHEATLDRDRLHAIRASLVADGCLSDAAWPTDRIDRLGATDPVGITGVDVGHVLDAKRRAIAAHASQVL